MVRLLANCYTPCTVTVYDKLTDAVVSVMVRPESRVAAAGVSTVGVMTEVNAAAVVIGTLVLIYRLTYDTHHRRLTWGKTRCAVFDGKYAEIPERKTGGESLQKLAEIVRP